MLQEEIKRNVEDAEGTARKNAAIKEGYGEGGRGNNDGREIFWLQKKRPNSHGGALAGGPRATKAEEPGEKKVGEPGAKGVPSSKRWAQSPLLQGRTHLTG